MNPDDVQPLSASASSSGKPVISMSSTAKPPKLRLPSVTYWNRSWTFLPAYGARSAVGGLPPGAVSPPDGTLVPFPRVLAVWSLLAEEALFSGVQGGAPGGEPPR